MKSENQNNSLFRPLKKASTVALVAFALFASAAHAAEADFGEPYEGRKADQDYAAIKSVETVTSETRESITLIKVDREKHLSCLQTINLGDKKGNVKKTICYQNTAANVAK
jgi:hypothetical protein